MLETLDGNDGTPFFMYVAFHNTHSPLDVSLLYFNKCCFYHNLEFRCNIPLQPKEEFLSLYDELDAPESRKKYLGKSPAG